MSLPDTARYERKFLPEGLTLPEVLALIRRHPACFQEVYPPRYVNSVYLDTPTHSDYHDHLAGLPRRSKTRVRWYGALEQLLFAPILERKCKSGFLGWKLSRPLGHLPLHGDGWLESVRRALLHLDPGTAAAWGVHQRRPVLLVRYHRRYFLSADRRFRLTLDTDLEIRGPSFNRTPSRTPAVPCSIILELKFRPEAAPLAPLLTGHFPFRLVRCSKYLLGCQLLDLYGL